MVMSQRRAEIRNLIRLARKAKDTRMRLRYDVIRLFLEGRTKSEIANILAITYQTARNYINAYINEGIEGLRIGTPPGRATKLNKEQEQRLYDCITTQLPKDVGFAPFVNWTAPLACQWVLETFGVLFSERGMRDVFYRLKLSYTRPTYTLKKADPEKQRAFKEEFKKLKKLVFGGINHILFEDESMIRDYQAISKTWFPVGRQRIIPTYGKHHGAKLIGILNYETGEVYVEEHDKYNAETFLVFLQHVITLYPKGKIVIILDNAKIHHAKLLDDFLQKHKDRLALMFLPPYSPDCNMIEELWGWLKASVINNSFFSNLDEIKLAVHDFIQWLNQYPDIVIDRLCLQF
jgi:transposase